MVETFTCWGNIQLIFSGNYYRIANVVAEVHRRPGYISESVSSVMVLFAQGHLTGTLHHSMYIHCI